MLASSYLYNGISLLRQRHSRLSSYFDYVEAHPILFGAKRCGVLDKTPREIEKIPRKIVQCLIM